MVVTSGTIGAALGYLIKAFLDHRLRMAATVHAASVDIAKTIALKQMEKSEYRERFLYAPLSRCLDRLTGRVRVALNRDWYVSYDTTYLENSFFYEAAALCFWLERLAEEVQGNEEQISTHDETKIRDALTTLTGLRLYDQKEVAAAMTPTALPSAAISFAEFKSRSIELLREEHTGHSEPSWLLRQILRDPTHYPEHQLQHDMRWLEISEALSRLEYYALKLAEHAPGARELSFHTEK